jgi:tetratricopeptide (TPR) repeat protein
VGLLQLQISAGELFEWMRPIAWMLSALVSAWVFASARRRGLRLYAVILWTLSTLILPLVVLPIYLIVNARLRRRERDEQTEASGKTSARARASNRAWTTRIVWPGLYLISVLTLMAVYFYRDYRSLDAHLWRANNAKLRGPHEKVIAEYRAALQLEDDPHTHKLLAIELAAAGRAEEALLEFRAAERGGEPDAQLPFFMGLALDAQGREPEALSEYKRFTDSAACTQVLPAANCTTARDRIAAIKPREGR